MSSFRRRLVRPYIKGTKTSPQTGQIITGSGNPALDEILGGGIPMNSIVLIEEDKHCTYSRVLCKYFLAEGAIKNQQIFLACLDEKPEDIFKKLPQPVFMDMFDYKEDKPQPTEFEQLSMDTSSLRIAWRYNDLPYLNIGKNYEGSDHQFNLLNFMTEKNLTYVAKVFWDGTDLDENASEEGSPKKSSTSPGNENNENSSPKQERIDVESADDEENESDGEENTAVSSSNMDVEGLSHKDSSTPAEDKSNEKNIPKQETTGVENEEDIENHQKVTDSQENPVVSQNNMEVEDDSHKKNSTPAENENNSAKQATANVGSVENVEKQQNETTSDENALSNHNGMDIEEEEEEEISSSSSTTTSFFTNNRFQRLTNALSKELRLVEFCRICIPSLGSPLWYDENFGQDLLKFLTILRAMVQNSRCACFLTMPMHLIAKTDETLVPKIRNLVDYSIELESFAGSDRETNPAFKDYNGLLHFRKMSAINSLALFQHSDLAFKLRRKKFVIEKFHLPPELEDNTDQDQESDVHKPTSTGCATSGTPNKLDF